jgi:hypothetical protein
MGVVTPGTPQLRIHSNPATVASASAASSPAPRGDPARHEAMIPSAIAPTANAA